MKSIEQKLKIDAQAFEMKFDSELQDKIIAKLKNESQINNHDFPVINIRNFAFSGLAMVFIGVLIFFLNYNTSVIKNTKSSKDVNATHLVNIKAENYVITQVAKDFETKMTNPIIKEQQALINDINYIKNLMFLN